MRLADPYLASIRPDGSRPGETLQELPDGSRRIVRAPEPDPPPVAPATLHGAPWLAQRP